MDSQTVERYLDLLQKEMAYEEKKIYEIQKELSSSRDIAGLKRTLQRHTDKLGNYKAACAKLSDHSIREDELSDLLDTKKESAMFADNLDQICQQKGIKSKELAAMTDLPESTISMIRTGKSDVKLRHVMRLANALNVTTDELIFGRKPELTDITEKTGLTQETIEALAAKKTSEEKDSPGYDEEFRTIALVNDLLSTINDSSSVFSSMRKASCSVKQVIRAESDIIDYKEDELTPEGGEELARKMNDLEEELRGVQVAMYLCSKAMDSMISKLYKTDEALESYEIAKKVGEKKLKRYSELFGTKE